MVFFTDNAIANQTPNAMSFSKEDTLFAECPHCDTEAEFTMSDIDEYGEIECFGCHNTIYIGDMYPNETDNQSTTETT